MTNSFCRFTGIKLNTILDFGDQPLGNGFLLPEEFNEEYFFKMSIGFSEKTYMLQLNEQPSPEKMFHDEYAFYSSTSKNMALHFKKFAEDLLKSNYLKNEDPFIVELGCNDGIFLKHIAKQKIRHLGIEPSINVAKVANESGINTLSDFFSEKLSTELAKKHGKVDAFIAANVMCHIPNLKDIIKGIKAILNTQGVLIFEDPYLGDVIKKSSYDQIYDEHVYIFSALAVQKIFNIYDMELIDVQPQNTHGGSMRYFISHKGSYKISNNVEKIINNEINLGLNKESTFKKFSMNVQKSRLELRELLKRLKSQGKKIAGYGATSKSTTILNYCNIGSDLIDYITDTTPIKQNKFSPGMHIPIVDYKYFKENPPDFAFLFAWNHSNEIMEKESDFTKSGGKWITHIPNVRVI